MPKNLIFTEKEAAFLKELIKNEVPFMIVGLSAANLQGASVVTQDVDLWFKDLSHQGIQKALKKVGGFYVSGFDLSPPRFTGDAVALYDIVLEPYGLDDFDMEFKHAVEVPLGRFKIKILPLEKIIKSKKALNRPKDQLTVPILEDALKILRDQKQKR